MLSNLPEVDAVIMDFDINLNLIKLTTAKALLKKKKILFLVGTRDDAVPMANKHSIIGKLITLIYFINIHYYYNLIIS